jgi:hypothetical protein
MMKEKRTAEVKARESEWWNDGILGKDFLNNLPGLNRFAIETKVQTDYDYDNDNDHERAHLKTEGGIGLAIGVT